MPENYSKNDIARMKGEFVQGLIDTNMLKIAPTADDETQWFKLKSGAMSPLFWSIQSIQDNPVLWRLAVPLLVDKIEELGLKFNKIAGVPEGMTATAAVVGYQLNKGVLTIRKQEKKHGQGGLIIGNLTPQDKVLVLEDVATTGMSIFGEAALKLHKVSGAQNVMNAIVLLDREQGAVENLRAGYHKIKDEVSGEMVTTNPDNPCSIRLCSVLTQTEAIQYWNPATSHHKAMKPIIEKYITQNTK
jgi:orotate phosphoribosyltransferase